MYKLYIANKNYSSWSLRPWILLKTLNIPFEEILIPFTAQGEFANNKKELPAKKVPVLHDEEMIIWDSLAIMEHLNEKGHSVWPSTLKEKSYARSICAEIHSGMSAIRSICSMNCSIVVELHEVTPALLKDINRINELILSCLNQSKGKFLFSDQFTGLDAFFAPIAFRTKTYQLKFDPKVEQYFKFLIQLPTMQEWYIAAIKENMPDREHDESILKYGKIIKDFAKSDS